MAGGTEPFQGPIIEDASLGQSNSKTKNLLGKGETKNLSSLKRTRVSRNRLTLPTSS
jgi:hypothetical protein